MAHSNLQILREKELMARAYMKTLSGRKVIRNEELR